MEKKNSIAFEFRHKYIEKKKKKTNSCTVVKKTHILFSDEIKF